MAYESGKIYWIVPQNNTGVALSVYGNTQVSENRNVIVWSKQDIADQLWRVDVSNGYARIKSTINDAYALNIWLGSSNYGNCDIHTWSGNLEDSKINFRTIDASQNLYLIQNYRNNADNNLYLTAESTASGANVKWTGRNTGLNQVWKLIEKTGGGVVGENILTYPCKTMRITQNYNGSTSHYAESHGTPADYPIDDGCDDSGRSYMYCPCDEMEVLRVYTSGTNTIWFKSTTPVTMPCGKDYVIMQVMHVETADLQKYHVGTRCTRGQALFPEGKDGADGYHFHIAMATGTALTNNNTGWIVNSNGSWVLQTNGRNLKPEEAFYVDSSFTNVVNSGGISFLYK